MRILFVASNPTGAAELTLEREITALQQRLSQSLPGQSVYLRFLPALAIEDLTREIAMFRPTIVHISAHSGKRGLQLASVSRETVTVDAQGLGALLDVASPPAAVYLSACGSRTMARELSETIPVVLGTTGPITNAAARSAAMRFYEHILSGATIGQAAKSGRALLRMLTRGRISLDVFSKQHSELMDARLVEPFRIVARFGDSDGPDFVPDEGVYAVQLGVYGCPSDATVVSFFTDDGSFFKKGQVRAEISCAKGPPTRGHLWVEDESRGYYGDVRVGAACMTGDGAVCSAFSTLTDALEFYRSRNGYGRDMNGKSGDAFQRAIANLIKYDGG